MPQRRTSVLLLAIGACSGQRVEPGSFGTVPMPAFAVSAQDSMAMEIQAPWTLTASDGSGLILKRVSASAVLQGPLAFTELHLYFHNPEDRIREGTFAITLPPRAAVSRFAMENNGQWMEAELVEKMKARRAYEDFLHRKQDPALLEKADGNQFTARVFPIPAKGDKHLVLSFSQDLPGERYTLPLRGLPKVERVDVRLALLAADGSKSEQVLAERNWQPDRDFVSTAPVALEAIAAGTLVAAQVAVGDATTSVDVPTSMTILVDTSASRTLGFAKSVSSLGKLIAGMRAKHGNVRVQVYAFDQETQRIFDGTADQWGTKQAQALLARGAAGASDLGQALAFVAGSHDAHARLLMFGDAVVTAGPKADQLVSTIKQMGRIGRVDVVLSGGIRDDGLATQLVRASSRPGAVLDADAGLDGVVAALGEKMLTDLKIDVRGASWVYPRAIASARPGTRVMVYARMPSPTQKLDVGISGQRTTIGISSGTPALVDRAVAAAEIDELEQKLANATGDSIKGLKADITARSIAARVISSQTSLLVLETEQDYVRYGIDRKALADILEVAADGSIVQKARKLDIAIAVRDPKPRRMPDLEKQTADKPKLKKVGEAVEHWDGDGDDSEEELSKNLEKSDDVMLDVATSPQIQRREPPSAPPAVAVPIPEPARETLRPRPHVDGRGDFASRRLDLADQSESDGRTAWPPKNAPAPLQGELATIMKAVEKRDLKSALLQARAWREREPGNVLALIGLGETLEAGKDFAGAARAYGSIIDLFPGRADLRRWAGERLERIGGIARDLAIDSYRRAVADRPDHLTGHRLLAYALIRSGKHADAFAAILAGLAQEYPSGRFNGGDRVLRDDAGLIGAAYAAAMPAKRGEITAALQKLGLAIAGAPSTRFILYWETDANDVDFHIQDARGGHAFYSSQKLPSGGELFADVTTGYGPECFAIPGNAKAGPYRLSIDYYSQGPMGYGMGLLQIVRHDGKGKLEFQDRPYIIMADHAYVDLGTFK